MQAKWIGRWRLREISATRWYIRILRSTAYLVRSRFGFFFLRDTSWLLFSWERRDTRKHEHIDAS